MIHFAYFRDFPFFTFLFLSMKTYFVLFSIGLIQVDSFLLSLRQRCFWFYQKDNSINLTGWTIYLPELLKPLINVPCVCRVLIAKLKFSAFSVLDYMYIIFILCFLMVMVMALSQNYRLYCSIKFSCAWIWLGLNHMISALKLKSQTTLFKITHLKWYWNP